MGSKVAKSGKALTMESEHGGSNPLFRTETIYFGCETGSIPDGGIIIN